MAEVLVESNFSLATKPTPACYWKKIWKGLNTMRQTWQFCDVVLTSSDNKLFTAHTAVLVASSSTFMEYFSGSATRTYSNGSSKFDIFLPETPADVLQVVLDFIYGITPATPIEILKLCVGAKYFGMDEAYAFCMKYFQTAKRPQALESAICPPVNEVPDKFKIGSHFSLSANLDQSYPMDPAINPAMQEPRVEPSVPVTDVDSVYFTSGFGGILSPDVTDSDSSDGRIDGLAELDLTDLTQASECPHLKKLRNQSREDNDFSPVDNHDEISGIESKTFCLNGLDGFVEQTNSMSGRSNDGVGFANFMMDDNSSENSSHNTECHISPIKDNVDGLSSCIQIEASVNNCTVDGIDTNIHANNGHAVSQVINGSVDDKTFKLSMTNPSDTLEDPCLPLSDGSNFQEMIGFSDDFVEPSFSCKNVDSGSIENVENDCACLTNLMCDGSSNGYVEIIPRLYSDDFGPIFNVAEVSSTKSWENEPRQDAAPALPVKSQRKVSRFVCQDCGEVFSTSYKIQTHQLKQHNKGKLFSCRHCPFKSPRKKDLQAHSLSQHGEKPPGVKIYTCPLCLYRCIDKNRYEEHEAIHQGIPKYKCPLCNKAYTTRRGMKTHLKYHSDNRPFKCSLCPSDFKVKSKLTDHMKLIHLQKGVKPFKCGYCEHYTALRGNCNQHIKKNHPGQPVVVIDTLSSTRKFVKNYDYAYLEGSEIDVYHEISSIQDVNKTLT